VSAIAILRQLSSLAATTETAQTEQRIRPQGWMAGWLRETVSPERRSVLRWCCRRRTGYPEVGADEKISEIVEEAVARTFYWNNPRATEAFFDCLRARRGNVDRDAHRGRASSARYRLGARGLSG
jgi:hypothetical protein